MPNDILVVSLTQTLEQTGVFYDRFHILPRLINVAYLEWYVARISYMSKCEAYGLTSCETRCQRERLDVCEWKEFDDFAKEFQR